MKPSTHGAAESIRLRRPRRWRSILTLEMLEDRWTPSFIMTDLGTLGGPDSAAHRINDSGQIVGWADAPDGERHAFLWENGVMTDLGTLGGVSSIANNVNAQGQVVGQSALADGTNHAFLWKDGTMIDLGSFAVDTDSNAYDINDLGQIVGEAYFNAVVHHGFLWDPDQPNGMTGTMVDLGALANPGSVAHSINNSGLIGGYTATPQTLIYSATSQNGTPFTTLPNATFPGGVGSMIKDINENGLILGQAKLGNVSGDHHAYLYENGELTDLSSIPADGEGNRSSESAGINSFGVCVGAYSYTLGEKRGYVYFNGTMYDLSDLVVQNPNEWVFGAGGINDKGQIVGSRKISTGEERAFLLTPTAVRLQVSASASAVAGESFSVTVTALDIFGRPVPGYTGQVHFSSTDGSADLPVDYTFTTNDEGIHSFNHLKLRKPGTHTIRAADIADATISGGVNIGVQSAALDHFLVAIPRDAKAGMPFSISVVAQDALGNNVTGYNGTIGFFSSDPDAVLPANTPLVNGVGTFTITLRNAGGQNFIVNDTLQPELHGISSVVDVIPGAAVSIEIDSPGVTRAGKTISMSLIALDAFGNIATGYTGTVTTTSTDPAAVLPNKSTLTNGVGTFNFTLRTTGSRTVTATDAVNGSISGTSGGIFVVASAVAGFEVTAPATTLAGSPFSIMVTTKDIYGNVVAGYGGLVKITSSDGQALLPPDANLTSGSGTFMVTLKTASNHTVSATDASFPSIAGSDSVTVNPDAAASLDMSMPVVVQANTPFNITVTARDAFGNKATGYTGTVTFTSSDPMAVLPANSTLPGGSKTFVVTLKTNGNQIVNARDTVNSDIRDTASVPVGATAPTAAAKFAVSVPANATAGVPISVTVVALDASDNPATGYTGTVQFTSNDGQAILLLSTTLVNGTASFTVVLRTAGSRTITATDTVNAGITGASTAVAVAPSAATKLDVTAVASSVAGAPFSVTVTARDLFNNVATGFSAVVNFLSTDGQAALPGPTPFVNGTLTTSATFKTAGLHSLVAVARGARPISGIASVVVNPAAVASFAVTVPQAETAGVPFAITVTARDAFGNTVTNYGGLVTFASTDAQAVLPANSTLINGSRSFTITLKTAGNQSVTATDTVNATITGSGSTNVNAAAATSFNLSLPTQTDAGGPLAGTVTAFDAFNNPTPNYAGLVTFVSSDGQAILPIGIALDGGTATVPVVLKSAGSKSVTVSDVNPSIFGSDTVTVNPTAAVRLDLTAVSSINAGTPFTTTIKALDAFGNVATSYQGTVFFAGNDYQADFPDVVTLVNGTATASVTLKTGGPRNLAVADPVHGGLFDQNTITINALPMSTFLITSPSIAPFVGVSFQMPVTARDAFNNFINTYNGTVTFSSSDPNAILPPNGELTNGIATFSFTMFKALQQTVTATDTANSAITGSVTFPIKPGPAVAFKLTPRDPVVAGVPFQLTVEAQDQYGNKAGQYSGTVHFTSSDPSAILPADSTLTNGVKNFSVTLFTVGVQTITATDTANSSIDGETSVTVGGRNGSGENSEATRRAGRVNALETVGVQGVNTPRSQPSLPAYLVTIDFDPFDDDGRAGNVSDRRSPVR